jgi:hypothetical protein
LFPLFATSVIDTVGKFVAGVITSGKLPTVSLTPAVNLPQVSLTLVANLPPLSTIPAKLVAKFAASVVDMVANLPPVLLIPAPILLPVSLTLVTNLPPVSLIPVLHLDLRISPRIFEKIQNGPNGILWGLGETDS